MADPQLVLILLVALGGDAQGPAHVGGAAREALGADARVVLEERSVEPADDSTIEAALRVHASAVATVRWADLDHREALVRMYVPDDARWYDRKLTFRTSDAPAERERAVGYFVGTMVRASMPPPREDASPSQGPNAIAPPPARTSRSDGTEAARAVTIAVDAAASGAVGVGGEAGGFGPSARLHYLATEHFGLALGGALRFGDIAGADAKTRALRGSAGVTWRTESSRASLMLALDVLLLNQWAEREDPPAARSRWIGGAAATVLLGYRVAPSLEPFVSLGAEVAWGATNVTVASAQVAEIPPLRAIAEVGLRVRF